MENINKAPLSPRQSTPTADVNPVTSNQSAQTSLSVSLDLSLGPKAGPGKYNFDLALTADSFQCYPSDGENTGHKPTMYACIMTGEGQLAMCQGETASACLLNDRCTIVLGIPSACVGLEAGQTVTVYLDGSWKDGRPDGPRMLRWDMDGKPTYFLGELTLVDGKCQYSGQLARPGMTPRSITINDTTHPAVNSTHALADTRRPVNFTPLLSSNARFKLASNGCDCLYFDNALATCTDDGEAVFLNGKVLIFTDSFTIEGQFERGIPTGQMHLTVSDGQTIYHYLGSLTIQRDECTFVCQERLADSKRYFESKHEYLESKHVLIDTTHMKEQPKLEARPKCPLDDPERLTQNSVFQCESEGLDIKSSCAICVDRLVLTPRDNNETYRFAQGTCHLSSKEFVFSGPFSNGQPVGRGTFTVKDGSTGFNYVASMVLNNGQCTFVCHARLLDGQSYVGHKGVTRYVSANGKKDEVPIDEYGMLFYEGTTIEGQWKKGQPTGKMTYEQVMDDKTIVYVGGMVFDIEQIEGSEPCLITYVYRLKCYGSAEKTSYLNSGEVRIYTGFWKNGVADGEGDYTVIKPDPHTSGMATTGVIAYERVLDAKIVFKDKDNPAETRLESGASKLVKTYHGELYDHKPSGMGKMIWADGSTYEGTFKDKQKHGYGTAKRPNGDIFVGNFVDDKRAQGCLTWANGDSYEGGFINDRRGGEGTHTFKDGTKIKGFWKDGALDKRYYDDGRVYSGSFDAKFEPNGKGVVTWPDGRTCEGMWKAGKLVGNATVIIPGKAKYVGPVDEQLNPRNLKSSTKPTLSSPAQQSKKQAISSAAPNAVIDTTTVPGLQGSPTSPAKSEPILSRNKTIKNYLGIGKYDGPVNPSNVPNGPGKITDAQGIVYEGQWDNGHPAGPFTITNPNTKTQYVGQVEVVDKQADQPNKAANRRRNQVRNVKPAMAIQAHGINGVMYTTDAKGIAQQQICKGDWEHGIPIKLTYPDERTFTGTFNESLLQPNGKCTMVCGSTGLKCEGTWKNGLLTGDVTLTFKDGTSYSGPVNKSYQPHGSGTMTLPDGSVIEDAHWNNGVLLDTKKVRMIYADKSVFVGRLNGRYEPHDKGRVLTLSDGTQILGQWDNGVFQETEKVRITFANKSIFVGFANKQYQAHDKEGVLTLPDGTKIEGGWNDGVFQENQIARVTFPNKSVFVGLVNRHYQVHDKEGELTLADGTKIKGEWTEGVIENTDVLVTFTDNSIYTGSVYSGSQDKYHYLPHGKGTLTVKPLYTYEGEFQLGRYYGRGAMKVITGDSFTGQFVSGSPRGVGEFFHFGYGGEGSKEQIAFPDRYFSDFEVILKHPVCGIE